MPRLFQYPGLVEPISQDAEETKLDKWFQPMAEPPAKSPFVFAAIFAAGLTFVAEPDTFEIITVDKWHAPLSEPLRVTPPLPVGAYPYWITDIEALGDAEVTTPDKWLVSLSEPVLPLRIETAFENPYSFDPFPIPTPETINVDKWLVSLAEPYPYVVRSEPALIASGGIYEAHTFVWPEITPAADPFTYIFMPENVTALSMAENTTQVFGLENVTALFEAENTTQVFGPENVTETVDPR